MSLTLGGVQGLRLMTCGELIQRLAAWAFNGNAHVLFCFRELAVTASATNFLHFLL
jgi:hypothetical protein